MAVGEVAGAGGEPTTSAAGSGGETAVGPGGGGGVSPQGGAAGQAGAPVVATTGSIEGYAILQGQANHAGIIVTLNGTAFDTVTDQTGHFVFEELAPGTYTLTGFLAGYGESISSPFEVVAGEHITIPPLVLQEGTGSLTGMALLDGATNHAGIVVFIEGTALATVTASNGAWSISDVPSGNYALRATREGYEDATASDQQVEVAQTTTVPTLTLLTTPGTVHGVVRLQDATDHSGILVTVNNTPYSGATAADGSFSITGVDAGVYSVSADAEDYLRYDYPLVVVGPSETVDLGEVTLERAHGLIRGVVELVGLDYHGGVRIDLVNTSYWTTSAADGTWELEVPIGTYPGVRATKTHFSDAENLASIMVTEWGVANVSPLLLSAVSNDVSGEVTLFGETTHGGVTVELVGLAGEVTAGEHFSVVTAADGLIDFVDVPIGPYDVIYTYQGDWETVARFVQVTPGDPIALLPAVLHEAYATINQDATYTNSLDVTIHLGFSDCWQVMIGNESDLSDGSWDTCAASKPWTLSGPDGTNTVYVRFQDSSMNESDILSDSIVVDTTATISAVTENTTGAEMGRNDVIHFTLDAAGEPGGTATIDIGTYETDIPLYDDGTHGDTTAGDGIYELDYTVTGLDDAPTATITGHFADFLGNVATPAQAAGTVDIAVYPIISNLLVVPDSATGNATISWDTHEDADALVEWGTDNFYGTQVPDNTFTTTHSLEIGGGTLQNATVYHFRIVTTDAAGNATITTDRTFMLKPNPPEMVIALPGDARFDVRWEAPPQSNVVGYNVYRADTSGGPYTKLNTAGVHVHEALMYSDLTITNGQAYFYVVTAEDEFGNESDYSEEVTGTPDVNSGPTTIPGGVLVGNQVWTTKGSPYIVEGNVLVEAGNYLAVGPGTEVRFNGDYFLQAEGQLICLGDSSAEVVLTSNQTTPSSGDWAGVRVTAGGPSGRFDLDEARYYGGTITYRTLFQYAGHTALKVDAAEAAIVRCTFNQNEGCWGGGVGVANESVVLVTDSVLDSNRAVTCVAGEPGIWGNVRAGGMAVGQSVCKVHRTEFLSNEETVGYFSGGCRAGGFAATSEATVPEVRESRFIGNRGDEAGGACVYGGSLRVIDSEFRNNEAVQDGEAGALWVSTVGCLTVIGSEIVDNTSAGPVGGIWLYGSQDSLLLGTSTSGNSAAGGGSSEIVAAAVAISASLRPGLASIVSCDIGESQSVDVPVVAGHAVRIAYTHFAAGGSAGALLQPGPSHSRAFELASSSIILGQAQLIENGYPFGNDVAATANYWGPTVTAEMNASGPNADISAIWDYYDDFQLSRVIYDNWAQGAFPLARIDTPRWGKKFDTTDTITFTGHADDPEDGAIPSASLFWESDIDGLLGTGASLDVTGLAAGTHQIWLTATDLDAQEGKIFHEVIIE